jgi:hypothetical protein
MPDVFDLAGEPMFRHAVKIPVDSPCACLRVQASMNNSFTSSQFTMGMQKTLWRASEIHKWAA